MTAFGRDERLLNGPEQLNEFMTGCIQPAVLHDDGGIAIRHHADDEYPQEDQSESGQDALFNRPMTDPCRQSSGLFGETDGRGRCRSGRCRVRDGGRG